MTENEAAALEELEWELSAPHTQEEIAARLSVDQKTVSNIEASALSKLRSMLEVEGKGDYCEGLSDPSMGLHRTAGEIIHHDGMTRTTRRAR